MQLASTRLNLNRHYCLDPVFCSRKRHQSPIEQNISRIRKVITKQILSDHHFDFSPLPTFDPTLVYLNHTNSPTHEANRPSLSTDCVITGSGVVFTSGKVAAVDDRVTCGTVPPEPNMAAS